MRDRWCYHVHATGGFKARAEAALKLNMLVKAVNIEAPDFIFRDIDLRSNIEERLGRALSETEIRLSMDLAGALKTHLNERRLARLLKRFDEEDKTALANELNAKLGGILHYPHGPVMYCDVLREWLQDVGEEEGGEAEHIDDKDKSVSVIEILEHVIGRKLNTVETFKVDVLQQAFEHQRKRGVITS